MKNTTWLVLLAAAILVLAFPAVVSAQAYSYTTVQTRTSPPAYACYLDGNVTMSSSVSGYSYDVSFGVSYEELAFPTIVFGFYLNKSSVGYKEFANSCRRNKASGEYAYCDIEIELSDSTVLSFGHEGKALPLVQSSGYDDGEATGTIILLLEMDKVRLGEIGLEDDRSKTMRRAVEKLRSHDIVNVSLIIYSGEKGKQEGSTTFLTNGLCSADTFDNMFDTLADKTQMRREYFHYSIQ